MQRDGGRGEGIAPKVGTSSGDIETDKTVIQREHTAPPSSGSRKHLRRQVSVFFSRYQALFTLASWVPMTCIGVPLPYNRVHQGPPKVSDKVTETLTESPTDTCNASVNGALRVIMSWT